MQIDGVSGVDESLGLLFSTEELEGVDCEVCKKKTNVKKGPLISRLPPVLTFCLNRITLDYETWTRKKINQRFEYPMELDMSKYCDTNDDENEASKQVLDPDLTTYELKSIVIHRGGPYGGHYHAYIRDDLGEGNWDLEIPEKFDEKPTDKKAKEEAEKKKKEEEEKKAAGNGEEEKKDGEEEKKEEDDWIDEKKIDWKSLTKK